MLYVCCLDVWFDGVTNKLREDSLWLTNFFFVVFFWATCWFSTLCYNLVEFWSFSIRDEAA